MNSDQTLIFVCIMMIFQRFSIGSMIGGPVLINVMIASIFQGLFWVIFFIIRKDLKVFDIEVKK